MIIGVTGNIASGKSYFIQLFMRRYSHKFDLIDMDKIGHKILEFKHIKKQLRKTFGDQIFAGDEIDRSSLRKIAFKNQKSVQLLNSIVHPALVQYIQQKTLENTQNYTSSIIDGALIIELQINKFCDKVIYIYSQPSIRKKRLMRRNSFSEKEASAIIDAQKNDQEKMKYADYVIDNNSNIETFNQDSALLMEKLFK